MSQREIAELRPADIETITGPEQATKAEITRMEKRGEVVAYRRHARRLTHGRIEIPYVRLRSRAALKRARAIRYTVFIVSATLGLAGVLWMLWTVRYFILATLVVTGILALYLRYGHGCPGHHCAGCKG